MSESSGVSALSNRVIGDPEAKRVLVVDDEETIRLALAKFLRSRGYQADTADSAASALAHLEREACSIMLCDIRMPGMSGVDLVPKARELHPDLAVIMLSAVNDVPTAAESISAGAMEYLTKPVDLHDLLAAIQRVAHRRDLVVEHRNVERLIEGEVARRTAQVEQDKAQLLTAVVQTLGHLVAMHEAKDPYRNGTSLRVAALSRAMAEAMGAEPSVVEQVGIAARLHDIGTIAIRDSVLNKPGALSTEELDHVQEHVPIALEMLAPLTQLHDVVSFVRDHHEHWDGTGYPNGLMGEQISLGGRIIGCADAFIALTSRRSYRPAMSLDDTVEYLAAHVGGLLDPAVYAALRTVVSERRVLGLTAD